MTDQELEDVRTKTIMEIIDFLEKYAKAGYCGEDVDGDYLAAQSIREHFLKPDAPRP